MKFFAIFTTLLLSLNAFSESSVTMYNFKSPYGVDWSTPATLTMSSIKNTLAYMLGITDNKRKIGHSSIEIKCEGKESIHTGMRAIDSKKESLSLLFKKNSALGVLFHRFKGMLDPVQPMVEEIKRGQKEGYINSVTYLIEDERCEMLTAHYQKWLDTKAYLNYGLIEDPKEYTGAGCSAYALSYLNITDIAPETHKSHWKSSVEVPTSMIGAHNRQRYNQDDQKLYSSEETDAGMNLFSLLLNADSWAKEGVESTTLNYWSPDMMYDWTKKAISLGKNQSPAPVKIEETGETHNIVFDARKNLLGKAD